MFRHGFVDICQHLQVGLLFLPSGIPQKCQTRYHKSGQTVKYLKNIVIQCKRRLEEWALQNTENVGHDLQ